jgi:hypothetical protein
MKAIKVDGVQTFGPYDEVTVSEDGFVVSRDGGSSVLPFSVVGSGEVADWEGPMPQPVVDLVSMKLAAIRGIDADTDSLYAAVMGNREPEYTLAEYEAKGFVEAGYEGAVPDSIGAWATAKAWTAQHAADDILATAAQWRGAQKAIRANRLLRKEQVRTAGTVAEMNAAVAAWRAFHKATQAALGAA